MRTYAINPSKQTITVHTYSPHQNRLCDGKGDEFDKSKSHLKADYQFATNCPHHFTIDYVRGDFVCSEARKYAMLPGVAKWLQNGKGREMASLTIRDLPDRTLASLKTRADMNRRSLNGEMLYILDYVVSGRSEFDMIRENRIAKQKEAFRAVFGKWRDSRSTDEIVSEI